MKMLPAIAMVALFQGSGSEIDLERKMTEGACIYNVVFSCQTSPGNVTVSMNLTERLEMGWQARFEAFGYAARKNDKPVLLPQYVHSYTWWDEPLSARSLFGLSEHSCHADQNLKVGRALTEILDTLGSGETGMAELKCGSVHFTQSPGLLEGHLTISALGNESDYQVSAKFDPHGGRPIRLSISPTIEPGALPPIPNVSLLIEASDLK